MDHLSQKDTAKDMKQFIYNRSGFTLLELTVVIVLLGLLASLAMPRLERDNRQEAADHILSNIRYTQHLALNDHKQLQNDERWHQRFWKIMFGDCNDGTLYFRIGSDDNMDSNGGIDRAESATDPLNGKALFSTNATCNNDNISENILIGRNYGVDLVNTRGGCSNVQTIGFDHLGRPHVGFGASSQPDYSTYMDRDCNITFSTPDDDTFSIIVEQETGFAYIDGQDDS